MKYEKNIIIDTDAGHDDVLAMILAIKSGLVHIKAITTVAGNSTIENVTRNAAYTLDLLKKREEIPLYSGFEQPLKRKLVKAVVHGESGLDGVDLSNVNYTLTQDAPQKIVEIIKHNPHEITLLTLGPLSNIARSFLQKPGLDRFVKQIVIMGGAINVPGNKNRVAEFNMFVDPEAADIVFRSQTPKVLIPIDICNDMLLTLSEFKKLKNSTLYIPIMNMMKAFITGIERDEGVKGALVYDAVAAYYLLNPSAFVLEPMDVVIETKGKHTFGMTVAEKRLNRVKNYNIRVATRLNKEVFVKDFIRVLKK